MEKVGVALVLYASLAVTLVYGSFEEQSEVNQWLHRLTKSHEKVTHLRFYVQEVLTGPNSTVTTVAQGPESYKSPTGFGLVNVIDDLLTEGPEPVSNPIGRAQGLGAYASKDELAFFMAINFVFTNGKLNGSSLTMLGRIPFLHPIRELPIVGGTGLFRLARGIVTNRIYQMNGTTNSAIFEYNVTAFHY